MIASNRGERVAAKVTQVKRSVMCEPFALASRDLAERLHPLDFEPQRSELPVRQIGRAAFHGQWLESAAQKVDLVELVRVEPSDPRSRVRRDNHEPLALQLSKGFPDGLATRSEARRDGLLVDPLARPQAAIEDLVAEFTEYQLERLTFREAGRSAE